MEKKVYALGIMFKSKRTHTMLFDNEKQFKMAIDRAKIMMTLGQVQDINYSKIEENKNEYYS